MMMVDQVASLSRTRSVIEPEAPELGRHGRYPVGTRTITLHLADQPAMTIASMMDGKINLRSRDISVRLWHPAVCDGQEELVTYEHHLTLAESISCKVSVSGRSVSDAEPVPDERFPLVILSHGFGGWNAQFSRLAEHLASRGYVVASIDHCDLPVASIPDFMLSFGNVLMLRTLDQRAVLGDLVAMARAADPLLPDCIDPGAIALMGYSMGGYGALATAGAPYSFALDPLSRMPPGARSIIDAAPSHALNALILFAPWGGQPANRAWSEAGLAKVRVPTLIVSGSEDDVVDHAGGVRWLFENLAGAERQLLTYREARHNIVGDPFDLADLPFAACEFLAEPVWRSERMNTINQHFVTAFLDRHLKGDVGKVRYLDVPCASANDGEWPLAPGTSAGGALAGSEQPGYWRGFPRRWAAGVALESRRPTRS